MQEKLCSLMGAGIVMEVLGWEGLTWPNRSGDVPLRSAESYGMISS